MEKDTTTNKKFNFDKFLRNVWLGSIVAFILLVAGSLIIKSAGNVTVLLMALSVSIGFLSFFFWIVSVMDKFLIKRFPKYRHWAVSGLVAVSVICTVFLMGLSRFTLGVDGNSMYPTIQNKDNILVNRWAYESSLPKRGDIVIYKRLNNSGYFEEAIGRVIGIPVETITIKEGYVFINEQRLDESYLLKGISTDGGSFLIEGQQYQIPSERFIILGDNRGHSRDSREHGQVFKENIIGKVFYRYWPLARAGSIKN